MSGIQYAGDGWGHVSSVRTMVVIEVLEAVADGVELVDALTHSPVGLRRERLERPGMRVYDGPGARQRGQLVLADHA